jgi:hypothetical protein
LARRRAKRADGVYGLHSAEARGFGPGNSIRPAIDQKRILEGSRCKDRRNQQRRQHQKRSTQHESPYHSLLNESRESLRDQLPSKLTAVVQTQIYQHLYDNASQGIPEEQNGIPNQNSQETRLNDFENRDGEQGP